MDTLHQDPMSESEIMRNHVLYQKSYNKDMITPRSTRSSSPRSKTSIRSKKKTNMTDTKKETNTEKKAPTSATILKTRTSLEELELRRCQRKYRIRPWQDKTPKTKSHSGRIQLFYDRTLPTDCDKSKINLVARKYVSNTKYGNIYEIRQTLPKRSRGTVTKSPTPKKWMWEEEYLLWTGGRDKYLEEAGSTRNKLPSVTTTQRTLRSGGFNNVKDYGRPNADVYASYNYHRLERTQRRGAAIMLQKVFRGFYVRSLIRRLKQKALLEHGRPWKKFITEYKELVSRVRSRYGLTKQSCRIDLKQIEQFLDKKHRHEKEFRRFAPNGKLLKQDLMEFFNRCDLWPTQRDINRSFDTIFRGTVNTAEIVFLLDCSTSTGIVGFHNLIKFVKDVIHVLDIAPDRTRVGLIPYNEEVFSSFGISTYHNKREILEAITRVKLWHGLTRTDKALRLAREMFKDSRPGVQKVGIVISDGQSTYPDKTIKEAQLTHEMGIKMFAVGIGNKADMNELQHIATTPNNLFHVLDVKSLGVIRRQIEKHFCLTACGFCRHLLPRIHKYGLLQNEVFDILWTTFPPVAANIDTICVLQRFRLGSHHNQPIKASSDNHVCRPIDQSETLDVVWTCYPPDACEMQHHKCSRWIRPLVDGKEAWSMLDDDIIRATGMRTCLRLVIQSRLHRHGYITVPSDVKNDVEQVCSETQALQIIEKFIKDRQSLIYPIRE